MDYTGGACDGRELDPIAIAGDEVVVDGVRIASEVLRTLVAREEPDPRVFYQFKRDGDSVAITAYRFASFTIHAGEP
jgi:hypothetical protein